MGFSIGSFLGKIAGPIISAIPGLGLPGQILGAGVSAGFAGGGGGGGGGGLSAGQANNLRFGRPLNDPRGFASAGPGPLESLGLGGSLGPNFPQVSQFGATSLIARGVGATGIVSLIASLFAVSRERTGQPINRKKVAAAVRVCGISMAASMFQLTELEICQIVISKGRRRGRGISAADLRRTRATLRKVHNIQHDLGRVKAVRRHHK